VLLAPARQTGQLTILTNAMAREVTLDRAGRADGVFFVNKTTGRDEQVGANVVVLAASACESARLLLNSKSALFPNGLGNSSGNVGKCLTDTTGSAVAGFIPALMDHVPHNEDGVGGGHIYVPWWLDNRKLDFPRGYHIEVYGGLHPPMYGMFDGIHRYPSGGGYGAELKQDYRRYYGATIYLAGRGEMVPNQDCYCDVDPEIVDRWGIPVLRFHWKWTEHELGQSRHMQETFRQIIREMGGEPIDPVPGPEDDYGLAAGGVIIHELGCTRMGDDPLTSVVNRNCQVHGVPNLFVADGGPFVSQADKNPTWTILALAWRTAEHIAAERKRRQL
jgi:choline dehydrogenase-like flavoprotein